ncbi:hypothetical protein GKODMF_14560 [Candidatus Electrothrix gigas]
MKYLLDSNTISELYDAEASHHSAILGHLGALTDRDQVCISVLSLYELEYGWANAPDEKKPAARHEGQYVPLLIPYRLTWSCL